MDSRVRPVGVDKRARGFGRAHGSPFEPPPQHGGRISAVHATDKDADGNPVENLMSDLLGHGEEKVAKSENARKVDTSGSTKDNATNEKDVDGNPVKNLFSGLLGQVEEKKVVESKKKEKKFGASGPHEGDPRLQSLGSSSSNSANGKEQRKKDADDSQDGRGDLNGHNPPSEELAPQTERPTRPVEIPITEEESVDKSPLRTEVIGNLVSIKSDGREVVNVKVSIQKSSQEEAPLVTRRDVLWAGIGAGLLEGYHKIEATRSHPPPQDEMMSVPLRDDILPPQSEFLKALSLAKPTPSPHSPDFVVYLLGYLINFDDEWKLWWIGQRKRLSFTFAPIYKSDPVKRATYVKEQFGDLAVALQQRVNQVSAKDLCGLLMARYSTKPGAANHQLAILFSFLSASEQPRDTIASILVAEMAAKGVVTNTSTLMASLGAREANVDKVVLEIPDKFLPPKLLPDDLMPVFENTGERSSRWLVPAVPTPQVTGAVPFLAETLGFEDRFIFGLDFGFNSITILLLALAGGAASATTNTLLHPFDNVKIRQQARRTSLVDTINELLQDRGLQALLTGIVACFFSTLCYGIVIYPGFEVGKLWLSGQVGIEEAVKYRLLFVWCASSFAAAFACLVAIPWESAKIRIIAKPQYADNVFGVFARIIREEGVGTLYAGYIPYLLRTIVFTIVKFTVFDYFLDLAQYLFPSLPLSTNEASFQLSLVKGAVAGILATFLSQPLDVILTKLSQNNKKTSFPAAAREVFETNGLGGFFIGVPLRAFTAASIISTQFLLYDYIKAVFFENLMQGLQ